MEKIADRFIDLYKKIKAEAGEEAVTMFDLVSAYNKNYDNKELLGGAWVRANIPYLKDLP